MKKIIIIILMLTGSYEGLKAQAYTWEVLGQGLINGTNGNTYAVTSYNGKIIYGGSFTSASGVSVSNIAAYDPVTEQWSALGTGVGGEVHALIVYNNELYAGGQFLTPGSNIAKWNGSAWLPLGQGTNGDVLSLAVYNNELAVGGDFGSAGGNTANNIARWNGSVWGTYGSGLTGSGDRVSALTVFSGNLVAGGRFDAGSANNVAKWNGSSWTSFNNDNFQDRVQALEVFNNELYVGGRFQSVGSLNTKYIVKWNGSSWASVAGGLDDGDVEGLKVYKNNLIVCGNFRVTGTSLYVDRIAQWTGTQWQRMLTGMNDRVNALYTQTGTDTILYAAGEFIAAGGKWSYHSAKWGIFATSTVTGQVRYADNNNPVVSGKIKAIRFDVITREIISEDSANISNGNYILPRVPKNGGILRIIAFPDDELEMPEGGTNDFVPTYYPSNLLWYEAGTIDPQNNQTNINVNVLRSTPPAGNSSVFSISGNVFLNIIAPPPGLPNVPYYKKSYIYIKQGSTILTYAYTNEAHQYSIPILNPGTYEMTVVRFGYEYETRQVTISSQNLTEDFTLDTLNPIGIVNINTNVPNTYSLRQNYPNPFNPVTNIEFNIVSTGLVTLKVYDILGKEITVLASGNMNAGTYKVDFDASGLPSGVYFYRLEAFDNKKSLKIAETKKMVLLK